MNERMICIVRVCVCGGRRGGGTVCVWGGGKANVHSLKICGTLEGSGLDYPDVIVLQLPTEKQLLYMSMTTSVGTAL